MSTNFLTKCEILAEVHVEASWNKELADFKAINDIGLPMAFLIDSDLVEPKTDSSRYIEETWNNLCKLLNLDPNKKYKNSDDFINKSNSSEDEEEEEEED